MDFHQPYLSSLIAYFEAFKIYATHEYPNLWLDLLYLDLSFVSLIFNMQQ